MSRPDIDVLSEARMVVSGKLRPTVRELDILMSELIPLRRAYKQVETYFDELLDYRKGASRG